MSARNKSNTIVLIIGLVITTGAGYLIGQSPISGLREESIALQSQVEQLTEINNDILEQLESISEALSTTQDAYEDLLGTYNHISEVLASSESDLQELIWGFEELELQFRGSKVDNSYLIALYSNVWEKYAELIIEYNNLTTGEPVGEMVVTEIPGIVNGDWEDGNEGWLTQGVSNLVGGVKFLHQNEQGTFITQYVTLTNREQGLKFKIKPQPYGGTIDFEVSLGDVVLFRRQYSGINSQYDWEDIIIPYRPYMQMREQYGFPIENNYDIRFIVPAEDNTGANIALDNISLVEVEYQPSPSRVDIFYDVFNDGMIDNSKWTENGTVTESGGMIRIGPHSKLRSVPSFGLVTLEFRMKIDTSIDPATIRLQAAGFRDSDDANNIIFHDWDNGSTSNPMTLNVGTKVEGYWSPGFSHSVANHTQWQTYTIERYSNGVRFYQNGQLLMDKTNYIPLIPIELEFASHGEYTFYIDDVYVTLGPPIFAP